MTPAAIALGSLLSGLLFIGAAVASIVIITGTTFADVALAWRTWLQRRKK
ncbi:hypothetical protein GV829_04540 [Sphingomonas lacunae]|uniref:Uncharacterized protein n=1 Tax=Sphingomonas lacunae TaxID=2698828 RepID=A0A6M4ARZ1_9SPHN|nr:hypothetical protein [Sphingomonas lacunae]QJQ31803.1 hypothetical protein GV829_04540 [Sphingomonas lacunae]